MAKKEEQKQSKREILDKVIETVEYLIIPAAAIGGIWGFDVVAYVAAFTAFIVAGIRIAKLFVK